MTYEEARALRLKNQQASQTAPTVPTAPMPSALGADPVAPAVPVKPTLTYEQARAQRLQKTSGGTDNGSDILGKKILDLKSQGQDSSQQEEAYQSLVGKPFDVRNHISNAGALDKARSFMIGIGQGGWQTTKNLLNLSNKGLNAVTSWVPGSEKVQKKLGLAGDFAIPERLTTPVNNYEKTGKAIEQVGEFLIPVGGEARAAALGAELTSKIPRVVEKAPSLIKAAQKLVSGVSKKATSIAPEMARSGLEFTGKTAAQTNDLEKIKEGGIIGTLSPIATKAISQSMPWFSKAIEKSNLRLTPSQIRDTGKKLDGALTWLADKKLVGGPESRLSKVVEMNNKAEDVYQKFLTEGEGKAIKVKRQKVVDELEALKSKYVNDADALAIEKQIDTAKDTLNAKQGVDIPGSNLNQLKRTTYKNAYNQAGTKVRDDVEHAIGDVYRSSLEAAAEGKTIEGKIMSDFNKEYGQMILARKLLSASVGRKQIGPIFRILIGGAGASMGFEGSVMGALAQEGVANFAATPVRSAIGAGANYLGASPSLAATPMKAIGELNTKRR
jgi:hypothetical protein